MIEELREIERQLEYLRERVSKLIKAAEKRRVRLSNLAEENVIGEVVERTVSMSPGQAKDARDDLDKTRPVLRREGVREGTLPVEEIADLLRKRGTREPG